MIAQSDLEVVLALSTYRESVVRTTRLSGSEPFGSAAVQSAFAAEVVAYRGLLAVTVPETLKHILAAEALETAHRAAQSATAATEDEVIILIGRVR